jgi:transposase
MNKRIAYLGLDVHKNSLTMALFVEQRQEEEFTKKVANNAGSLLKLIKKLSEEYHLRVCYEASGCGYTIYRKLIKHGIDCIIVAPSLIPTDHKKIKTDKIDAIKLAKYLRSGLLTAINVPDEQQERDRDLIRFRIFQVNELARIKQSICAFLLRKGIHYSESTPFTQNFVNFIGTVELPDDDRTMLNRLIGHYNYQNSLVNELTDDIGKLSQTDRYKEKCAILCGFRGVQTITAMTLLTHIADFRAFPHPSKLMSYIGLTSKEYSSGDKSIKKGITKQGSSILRKAIILSAQQYNRAERTGIHMLMKRKGLSSPIIALVQKADRRLKSKYFRLIHKGKNSNVAKTAVARELISFIWEAMIIYHQGEIREAS